MVTIQIKHGYSRWKMYTSRPKALAEAAKLRKGGYNAQVKTGEMHDGSKTYTVYRRMKTSTIRLKKR